MKLEECEHKIRELQDLHNEIRDEIQIHLREILTLGLWKERGSKSMQDYCKTHLGYSHFEARDLMGSLGVILTTEQLVSDDPMIQSRIERLKAWRRQKSRDAGVAAFRIFSNRTLLSMAQENPQSPEALLRIPGMGQKRMENFGHDLLQSLKT